jgi:hypothetical protein
VIDPAFATNEDQIERDSAWDFVLAHLKNRSDAK